MPCSNCGRRGHNRKTCSFGAWKRLGYHFGQDDLVDAVLTRAQPNINTQDDDGNTALMLICQDPDDFNNSLKHVKSLLKLGANPNIQNSDGDTALILLCSDSETPNRVNIAELLLTRMGSQTKCNYAGDWVCPLKYNTNIFLYNNDDDSALSMAINARNASLAQLLNSLGASYDGKTDMSKLERLLQGDRELYQLNYRERMLN